MPGTLPFPNALPAVPVLLIIKKYSAIYKQEKGFHPYRKTGNFSYISPQKNFLNIFLKKC